MNKESNPYAGLNPGKVVDDYRRKQALINVRIDDLSLIGFPEKIHGLLDRINNMQAASEMLRSSISQAEFKRANRPYNRIARYLGETARAAFNKTRRQ